MSRPAIEIITCSTAEHYAACALLFREYALSLNFELCFEDFEGEVANLADAYRAPRGCILLARVDGVDAGCCALRPIENCDYANAAEMKRLYVPRAFRGFGLGRALTQAVLDYARMEGYHCVLLDTLDEMETARDLYEDLGFAEIPPYYQSPIEGAHYLKVDLA